MEGRPISPEDMHWEVPGLAYVALLYGNIDTGFCIDCAEEHNSVDPNVMDGECNNCGSPAVYGAKHIASEFFCDR